ncbi:helix-turn-helix transcriptional regulator [Leuconostocaceae bacterium ESL0723]|nr:helix-turn-helix transcriptional regulator [Lactobacillaceae bacterium L1_55_11]WEV54485.1 helix-turn-helix transcriptional regulator [Leuconostocaceae bacterium ESL0723]
MSKRVRPPYYELKQWLSDRQISQIDLAKTLGTTSNYINKKINGTGADFRLSEVRLLVAEYGIPVDLFFTIQVPFKE